MRSIAYDVLRVGGALVLIVLGLRALLQRRHHGVAPVRQRRRVGWRTGLVTSLSNPKLAIFFVALFPQFVNRDAPVLPLPLTMAGVIVALDVVWFSLLTYAVDRARGFVKPRVQRLMERFTGAVMVGLGVQLAAEAR